MRDTQRDKQFTTRAMLSIVSAVAAFLSLAVPNVRALQLDWETTVVQTSQRYALSWLGFSMLVVVVRMFAKKTAGSLPLSILLIASLFAMILNYLLPLGAFGILYL